MPDQSQSTEEIAVDLCAAILEHIGAEGATAEKLRAIWLVSENDEQFSNALTNVEISAYDKAAFVLAKRQEAIGTSLQIGYNPPKPNVDAERLVIVALATMREHALALTHNLEPTDIRTPYYRELFNALRETDGISLFSEEHREDSLTLAEVVVRGATHEEVIKAVRELLDIAYRREFGAMVHETMLLTQTNQLTYEQCKDRLMNNWQEFLTRRIVPNWHSHPIRLNDALAKAETRAFDA